MMSGSIESCWVGIFFFWVFSGMVMVYRLIEFCCDVCVCIMDSCVGEIDCSLILVFMDEVWCNGMVFFDC